MDAILSLFDNLGVNVDTTFSDTGMIEFSFQDIENDKVENYKAEIERCLTKYAPCGWASIITTKGVDKTMLSVTFQACSDSSEYFLIIDFL